MVAKGVNGVAKRTGHCALLGLAKGGERLIAVDATEEGGLGAGLALGSGFCCFARGGGRRTQWDAVG